MPSTSRTPDISDARWRRNLSCADAPVNEWVTQPDVGHGPLRFRSILVLLDGTTHGERALPLAVSIARQAGASLRLLHIYAPVQGDFYPRAYSGIDGEDYRRQSDYMRRVARQVSEAAEINVTPQCVRRQNVVQAICEAASRSTDLVVAATRGHGWFERLWSGSLTHELIEQVPAPMLLLRGDGLRAALTPQRWLRRMLIPLDGSQRAEQVLGPAMGLGSLFDAEYSLLNVASRSLLGLSTGNDEAVRAQQIAAQEYQRWAIRRLRQHSPKTFGHFEVTKESVASAIAKRATSSAVDCIAMARGRYEGVSQWLTPSVTHRVIELAQMPILVIPPVYHYAALRLP